MIFLSFDLVKTFFLLKIKIGIQKNANILQFILHFFETINKLLSFGIGYRHPMSIRYVITFLFIFLENPPPTTCLEFPCQNEGTCELDDKTEEYNCKCQPFYIGDKCQNPIGKYFDMQ